MVKTCIFALWSWGSDGIVQIIIGLKSFQIVDYFVDYPEVTDNLQDKTKRLLSLQKIMQIRTNRKVRSNPKGLSFL